MVETRGQRYEAFCAKYLRHTSGQWAGKPFILEPWQSEWTHELLTEDPRYQQALLGVARGNGKSALASSLVLYFLLVESINEPGAEIYSVASALHQARIVFGDAKKMLESSSLFPYTKVYRDAIEVPSTGAIYRVLPAGQPEKLHGLRPYFYIADEVHAIEDGEVWYALSTAQLKRPNSLGVGITTAGFNLDSLCGDLYTRGKTGEEGFYFKWYAASDPNDLTTAIEANPASWITPEVLERESKRNPVAVFKRLHCNLWTRAIEQWLPQGAWADCKTDDEIPQGEYVTVGLDLGFTDDHSAVVEVHWNGTKYVTRSTIFATHSDPSKPAPLAHHVFESERQSHQAVLAHILAVSKRNPISAVVYDPFGSTLMVEELEENGITCIEYPQTHKRMALATDVTYSLITNELVTHDGDEAYAAHIDAATTKQLAEGLRLSKDKHRSPMDSAIALAIALYIAHEEHGSDFNVWWLGPDDKRSNEITLV